MTSRKASVLGCPLPHQDAHLGREIGLVPSRSGCHATREGTE
jgi:hypothetical protein